MPTADRWGTTLDTPSEFEELPFTPELSVTHLAGRIDDPRQAIADAVDADRLGLHRVWLSERYDLKDAGVVLGASAAATRRVGLATGVVAADARRPLLTAALAESLQAISGGRVTLGLGRGVEPSYLGPQGLRMVGLDHLADYVRILRRLWAGETVRYDGPAGRFDGMRLVDRWGGPAPQVYFGTAGGPQAARITAQVFDGVFLFGYLTVEAVADTVMRIRVECERIGRNPAEVRIVHCVASAPNLDEQTTREIIAGRAVSYFQMPTASKIYARRNGWDPAIFERLRNHKQFRTMTTDNADQHFRREQLLEPAELIPQSWLTETSAMGPISRCLQVLNAYFQAGTDEICLYGSSPRQNAELLRAWAAGKNHPTTRSER
ncbi:MAG TPA: TIGR03857 family LLM class F420-dependent oxidoreductase [Pseudonocardia sp.]|jgi:probable F420-dependent oxidoreductase